MTRLHRPLPALALPMLLLLAACTAGPAAPSESASTPVPAFTAITAPSESAGASDGGAGAPGVTPIPIGPGGPGSSPGPIGVQPPQNVKPVAGLLDIRDIRAESVGASVSGGHVTATVVWWSGPAPCSDLSEIAVARSGNAFTLTVREGAKQLGIACPAIAMHKSAAVDLGALPAGSYTIAVAGVDTPISVTVPG